MISRSNLHNYITVFAMMSSMFWRTVYSLIYSTLAPALDRQLVLCHQAGDIQWAHSLLLDRLTWNSAVRIHAACVLCASPPGLLLSHFLPVALENSVAIVIVSKWITMATGEMLLMAQWWLVLFFFRRWRSNRLDFVRGGEGREDSREWRGRTGRQRSKIKKGRWDVCSEGEKRRQRMN